MNKWVRITTGAKRVDRRRVNVLREETGMQFSTTRRVVRDRIMWASHLVQVEEARLPRKAEAVKHSGRPQLRRDDCIKRDVRKAEEGDK